MWLARFASLIPLANSGARYRPGFLRSPVAKGFDGLLAGAWVLATTEGRRLDGPTQAKHVEVWGGGWGCGDGGKYAPTPPMLIGHGNHLESVCHAS